MRDTSEAMKQVSLPGKRQGAKTLCPALPPPVFSSRPYKQLKFSDFFIFQTAYISLYIAICTIIATRVFSHKV